MKYMAKHINGPAYELTLAEMSNPKTVCDLGISADWVVNVDGKWISLSEFINSKSRCLKPSTISLFFILKNEEKTGPYVEKQIYSMWNNGQLTADCFVVDSKSNAKKDIISFVENCQSEVRNIEPVVTNSEERSAVTSFGILFLVGGLICAAYFFVAFDTSVSSSYGGRVNNIGLLNQRQNGIMIGIGASILGGLLIIIGKNNKKN